MTFISTATGILTDVAAGHKKFVEQYGQDIKLHLFVAKDEFNTVQMNALKNALLKTDFLFLDLRLSSEALNQAIVDVLEDIQYSGECVSFTSSEKELLKYVKYGQLNGPTLLHYLEKAGPYPSLFSLINQELATQIIADANEEHQIDLKELQLMSEYWTYANGEHLLQLLILIMGKYNVGQFPTPTRAFIINDPLIYHIPTNEVYDSLDKYSEVMEFSNELPTIGILYLGYNFRASQVDCVWEIVDRLQAFANVVPIFVPGISSIPIDILRNLLTSGDKKIDLIMNFVPFRIGAGPMGGNSTEIVAFLEELAVPVLRPFFLNKGTKEDWEQSVKGVSSSEYLISIMLPELDGAIDTFPVGAIEMIEGRGNNHFTEERLVLIEDRVERLIGRTKKLLQLQRMKNEEKKVAIICYNYPPGEGSIFGGSFLDTFASVENMLGTLHGDGYNVPVVTKKELMETFTAGKILNFGKWTSEVNEEMIRYPVTEYIQHMKEKELYQDMLDDVGEPPGNTMTEGSDFLIPGKQYGSVFVGLQPSRSADGDMASAFHDQTQYPDHQYIAYYVWLKEVYKADVIIHVGTHGTLEFLKGKEVAISSRCTPDELIGDLPHLYIYYMGNPSEAMIAKRRSLATLISYQTPSYTTSDLYAEYVELEELLANYEEAKRLDPVRCQPLLEKIKEKATLLNFEVEDIHNLEVELYRMKRSLIPRGLHIFGKGYSEEDAVSFMKYCLRYDRGHVKALGRLIAEDRGLDYDKLLQADDTVILSEIEQLECQLVDRYMDGLDVDETVIVSENIRTQLQSVFEYGKDAYYRSMDTQEGNNLLKGLSGEYLPVHLASDIVKNPEILPSGFNLYQFDPRQIPEDTATERGSIIAENTIRMYFEENGRYPVSTGVVLWGFETSRTQGESIGQILHYLGVRVQPARGGFIKKFEIIPLEELKRPRLDVVMHMTGFFRDIFPNVIDQLNEIIAEVAQLNEPSEQNYVKANYERLYDMLLAEGESEEDARMLASARIFGPQEGAYSTRVPGLIDGGNWQDESELAVGYMRDIQYLYSDKQRGRASYSLLEAQLNAVDIVSQIRSNHEFEVTDLDHYYEFFGGFQKSVETTRGEKVPILISDTTGETVLTENVKTSIERGARTRLLNPKWIDGLLEHEYHGTSKILERFENMIGLSATTNEVDSWIFSGMHETYVADEDRRKQLQADNPWAYHSMLERLFESNQRGYWDATEEELQQLKEVYLSIEGTIEEKA